MLLRSFSGVIKHSSRSGVFANHKVCLYSSVGETVRDLLNNARGSRPDLNEFAGTHYVRDGILVLNEEPSLCNLRPESKSENLTLQVHKSRELESVREKILQTQEREFMKEAFMDCEPFGEVDKEKDVEPKNGHGEGKLSRKFILPSSDKRNKNYSGSEVKSRLGEGALNHAGLYSKEKEKKKRKQESWMSSKKNSKSKERTGPWKPKKVLSREDMTNLKRMRQVGLTKRQLAEKFKISYQAVSRILHSKFEPDEKRLAKVEAAQKKRAEEQMKLNSAKRKTKGSAGEPGQKQKGREEGKHMPNSPENGKVVEILEPLYDSSF
eukprot:Nk52_evm54s230 gene=Nk52_evmTU54s230